ncbi:hypothetical protein ACTXJX_12680 [Glutamicibacter ardleyensis]
MATTKKPTEMGANILRAMLMAGINQQNVYEALGISYNTWRKRLETDGFTIQELVEIGNITGLGIMAIIPQSLTDAHAA